MLEALLNLFHIPGYLLRILRDYLKDRALLYETQDQGSIVWNADCLLRFEMPDESHLGGCAEFVAALVTARTIKQLNAHWE